MKFTSTAATLATNESDLSSPENKISRKDQHFIKAMMKLNESMDKNILKEKEPGINRLKSHKKNLILNTSATPPFDTAASAPSEFYLTFLAKKSQFKAKDMLYFYWTKSISTQTHI